MSPAVIRYPGGTVANYWNWREGDFLQPYQITSGVTGISIPQNYLNANSIITGKDRAMLGLEIHPSHVGMRKTNAQSEKSKQTDNQISVFPNPTKDKLLIKGLPDENCEIEIYDCYCRLVYKKSNTSNNSAIDVRKFASGVYNLSIKNKSTGFSKAHFTILK